MDSKNYICIFGIILAIIFAILYEYRVAENNNYCESKGYDFSDNQIRGLEPGYIRCCNNVYIDHIETNQCEVIPRG